MRKTAIPIVAVGVISLSTPNDQGALTKRTDRIPGTAVEFVMVRVPSGTFTIGSPLEETGRGTDEGPQRTVSVQSFWIGVHEVTHDEFAIFRFRRLDNDATEAEGRKLDVDAITRPSPPYEDPAHGMGAGKHPAAGMTQWSALQYARWLSEKTGRLYRLPTEVEWEYACRAGTRGSMPSETGADGLDAYAWYAANSDGRFHVVGNKNPNAWGLTDMLGNVAEWTMDQYDANFYERLGSDSVTWNRPSRLHPRTVRGGSFQDVVGDLRCANRIESTLRWKRRDPQLPRSRWWNTDSPHVGFRLVSPDVEMSIEEIRQYWTDHLGGR